MKIAKKNRKGLNSRYKVGDNIRLGSMRLLINQVESIGGTLHYSVSYRQVGSKPKFGWVFASFFEDFVDEHEADTPTKHSASIKA